MNAPHEKATFTRHVVAQNIKEKTIAVVDRIDNNNIKEICAALDTLCGILDLDYEKLSENCNRMRQGNTEQIQSYFAIRGIPFAFTKGDRLVTARPSRSNSSPRNV